jgi:hypothetical protein
MFQLLMVGNRHFAQVAEPCLRAPRLLTYFIGKGTLALERAGCPTLFLIASSFVFFCKIWSY